ncbi:MAG: DUF5018 domain-containing protein [Spirochaetaceae bacterium]|jgi:hypothetical protein|nr:DUF5018 domain-containing protein [Spirochaetaceae bacterium]
MVQCNKQLLRGGAGVTKALYRAAALLLLLTAAVGFFACSNVKDTPDADSRKEITAFLLKDGDTVFEGTIEGKAITVSVPDTQKLTGLTADITYTGIEIHPAPNEPANYTVNVAFTVTAANGSMAEYTVHVVTESEAKKLITGFTLPGAVTDPIDHTNGTITVTVPHTTTQTIFTPDVVVSLGATYTPKGPQDFAKPVIFTVTAADGIGKKTYQVTVTKAAKPQNTTNTIEEFVLLGHEGVIDHGAGTITIGLPASTSTTAITNVAPGSILHTGASISPAEGEAKNFTASTGVAYTVTSESGSPKTYTVTVTIADEDSADIQVFRLAGALGKIEGTDIEVTVPYGTDLSLLIPVISHNGKSIEIDPMPDADGYVDFSSPVTITVTAENDDTKVYTVTAKIAKCSYKTITGFIFPFTDGQPVGTINNSDVVDSQGNITGSTITVIVPNGTNFASLTPTITVQEPSYTSIIPASGVAKNFYDPVQYVVTAEDGTTNTYTVIVMMPDPTSKSILNFVLPGQLNVEPMIDHGDTDDADGEITVLMPIGASLINLAPTTIIHTGKSVPNANVPKNFDSPVSYTVEAVDGTTKPYAVRITNPLLPPLPNAAATTAAGYEMKWSGGLYSDSKSGHPEAANPYLMIDNDLNSYTALTGTGTMEITWGSSTPPVNRIRVFLNESRITVEFRDTAGEWETVLPTTAVSGEFVQTIPEYTGITGVRIDLWRFVASSLRIRIREFIIE